MLDARSSRVVTILLFGAGAVFAGMGIALFMKAWFAAADVEEQRARAESACVERLRTLGQVQRTDAGVRLTVPELDDPQARLADASATLGACPGWTLSYVCMGMRCLGGAKVAMIVDLTRPE